MLEKLFILSVFLLLILLNSMIRRIFPALGTLSSRSYKYKEPGPPFWRTRGHIRTYKNGSYRWIEPHRNKRHPGRL